MAPRSARDGHDEVGVSDPYVVAAFERMSTETVVSGDIVGQNKFDTWSEVSVESGDPSWVLILLCGNCASEDEDVVAVDDGSDEAAALWPDTTGRVNHSESRWRKDVERERPLAAGIQEPAGGEGERHGSPVLMIWLRMSSSLCMQAISAAFFGVPLATSR